MLRALLLGLLAVSTASCTTKNDAPAVAVGTAAGKVVELSGKVTATRNGQQRDLAAGAEVFADDQIATAADGAVTIELFHNGVRWAVLSGKTARVDTSLAWGLDKQAAAKHVEHNSAAAGRNAERSAAETAATADTRAPASAAPVQPTGAMETTEAPVLPPPPPPPPPDSKKRDRGDERSGGGGGRKLDKGAAAKTPDLPPANLSAPAEVGLEHYRADFKACLDLQSANVTITVTVTNGAATVKLAGDVSDKMRACAEGVAKQIKVDGDAKLTLRF